jgi:hypothetical protein
MTGASAGPLKGKPEGKTCFIGIAPTPEGAYSKCSNAIGRQNCKAPVGGCNDDEDEDEIWGAVAGGASHNPDWVTASVSYRHPDVKVAESIALGTCNKDAVAHRYQIACKIMVVWTKGCGYASLGCLPRGEKK